MALNHQVKELVSSHSCQMLHVVGEPAVSACAMYASALISFQQVSNADAATKRIIMSMHAESFC